ncbi:MAG TPA: DUF6655 family protein [Rhizomicrobium sp.]|nr:DUF6655 family protein [Rhizomicrobium sp.]
MSPRLFAVPIFVAAALLAGCTAQRISVPVRTATEELLISSAADRAAAQLLLGIPKDTRIFVDRQYFQGYDDGYAINAIRTQFLRQGLELVDNRADADAIVTVASGALSTDEKSLLIGIPQLTLPFLPVGNSVTVPEISVFKSAQDKATAKFVATGYDAKTGKLIATTNPQYGFSHQTNHTILLFFSWETGDLIPPNIDQNQLSVSSMAHSIPDELGGLMTNLGKAKPP